MFPEPSSNFYYALNALKDIIKDENSVQETYLLDTARRAFYNGMLTALKKELYLITNIDEAIKKLEELSDSYTKELKKELLKHEILHKTGNLS